MFHVGVAHGLVKYGKSPVGFLLCKLYGEGCPLYHV